LTDKGSSYGCYVGEEAIRSSAQSSQDDRVPKGEHVVLNKNVRIRFGLRSTIFKLVWLEPFIVCTSKLSAGEKRKTISLLNDLEKGCKVVVDCSGSVTFLAMREVILTIKVANALAKGVPIVSPNFFEDYMNCTKTKQVLPNPKNYIPKLKESTLNPNDVCLEANTGRQSIFKGKLLAFLSKEQMSKFNVAIEYAGGRAVVLDNENPKADIFQIPVNMMVQPESNENLSDLWICCLQRAECKGFKPVPEIQIGLAIITMNTAIYCNPAAIRQVIAKAGKCSSTYADSNSHIVLAHETQIGKTQKRITQAPPDQTQTGSTLCNNKKNIDESILGPTPGPSKSQFSEFQTNEDDDMTAPVEMNAQLDGERLRQIGSITEEEVLKFPQKKSNDTKQNINTASFNVKEHNLNLTSVGQRKLRSSDREQPQTLTLRAEEDLQEKTTAPKNTDNINIEEKLDSLKCDSVIKSPRNRNTTPKKNMPHIVLEKNVSPKNQNLFDFELDKSNDGRETRANNRKRKNETPFSSEKQSTQKRHCFNGSASDENEFEADTFDFELSPIKKKCTRNSDENGKSENVVQVTTNHNKRKINEEENAENGNMSKIQKLREQKEDRNLTTSLQLHLTNSSIQSTQQSKASSFLTTSYGFIGKRVTPNTSNNGSSLDNSNKKCYSDDSQSKVKNENLKDKNEALLEVTKSFVSLEVVPLVVKKCLDTTQLTSRSTKKIGNVKKFKKQAFVQNRNLIQSKPVLIDLTMQRNGAISRSHDSGTSNRKTSLWSENGDESQVQYEENNTRNEAEEREVDAFWNFQTQESSQSFQKRNMRRTNAR
jgi:hypothetical protein